jgi:hypothetical protein
MNEPTLKALVLCEEITESLGGSGQKDLRGAGLKTILNPGFFPFKHSFWVYIEISSNLREGDFQLSLMRADSGRRHYFREIAVAFADPVIAKRVSVRLFDCVFASPGVYFVELWYDGKWLQDQRFETV